MISSIGFIFVQNTQANVKAQIITLTLLPWRPASEKLTGLIIMRAATKISPAMTGFIDESVVFTM